MIPTLSVAFFSDISDLTGMNDVLNALMAILLPFAVIPAITFSSSRCVEKLRLAMAHLARSAQVFLFCHLPILMKIIDKFLLVVLFINSIRST